MIKNPHANTGDLGSIPELGRCPGKGNGSSLQYSFLVQTEEPSWGTVHGVAKCQDRT